jgi:hypothetical protein
VIDLDFASIWQLWVIFAVLGAAGAFVTWRAVAAYLARRTRPLALLAGGIGLMTLGMPLAWTFAYALTGDMFACTVSSSSALLVGAGALVGSVQMRSG